MKLKYLLIISIALFTCISIFGKRIDIKTENKYLSGKLTANFYINKERVVTHNGLTYGIYMLEPNTTMVGTTRVNIGKDGKQGLIAQSSTTVTKGYFLLNLRDSTCSEFDTIGITPVFKSKISIDKENGFKIKGNFNESIEMFVYVRDTLIDQKSYKILMYDYKDKPSLPKEFKIVLYLLRSPQYFPYHPFNKFLDNKFGGIITRCMVFGINGQSQFIKYDFQEGLDKFQEDKIRRFIAADKRH